MTTGFNIFKDKTPADRPAVSGLTVSSANICCERDVNYVGADGRYANSVDNLPNVVRGHDVNGGQK